MSILVHKVSKSLHGSKILDRVSFYVPNLALVALLGPSGSGKSTSLRIIAGLESCERGSIWLHGADITDVSTQYRNMGFVFQQSSLFKHMTVYENVSFGLRLRGFPHHIITNKVKDLLNCLRISDISSEYPAQLSGGQKQRVALARSLAIRPDFLLLDEPFGALDGELRRNLNKWLKRHLRDNNITTITVTHDQREAISMADEIFTFGGGRLLQRGRPENIYDQPIDYFVGIFLGLFIEIPEVNRSVDNPQPLPNNLMELAPDPDRVWAKALANRSGDKSQSFLRLRPYEFRVGYEGGLGAAPARIARITYKRNFVQLDLFVTTTSRSCAFTIPMGYPTFRDLNIQSLPQTLFIEPRIQNYSRLIPDRV